MRPGRLGTRALGLLLGVHLFEYVQAEIGILGTVLSRPEGGSLVSQETFASYVTPGQLYRADLWQVEGRPVLRLEQPPIVTFVGGDDLPVHLVSLGEAAAYVTATAAHTFTFDDLDPVPFAPFEAPPADVRIWSTPVDGRARSNVGLAFPDLHRVGVARIVVQGRARQLSWPPPLGLQRIGHAGVEPGSFLYPVAVAGSQDGRIYVVDAGNQRVQAFDADGNYLSHWGRPGTGAGEFAFGSLSFPDDLAGSIAVDANGFIYVADVGNQRIQKFAP